MYIYNWDITMVILGYWDITMVILGYRWPSWTPVLIGHPQKPIPLSQVIPTLLTNRLPRGLQDFLPNRDNLPLLVAAVDQGLNFKPLLLISHLHSLSSDQQGLTNGLNAKLFEVFLAAALDPPNP